jgi:drug/metabolite transporter (DMT)-like permease
MQDKPTSIQPLLIPAAFVLLWSTGFIGAKLGLPYAEPFTFLFVRLLITAGLLATIALLLKADWPQDLAELAHIGVVGVLLHAAYLGGVFYAIYLGMPTGIAALIVGLQPILTAVLARAALNETVTLPQWIGLALGFGGVALTVLDRTGAVGSTDPWSFVAIIAALCGITLSTIYQKRFCTGMNLLSGTALQYMAAAGVLGMGAMLFEDMDIEWTGQFMFAIGWLVLVLSVGAVMLLMILIKRGSAASVTSLFYLVPPLTAVLGFMLFDERLGLVAVVGMALVILGVALVIGFPGRSRNLQRPIRQ